MKTTVLIVDGELPVPAAARGALAAVGFEVAHVPAIAEAWLRFQEVGADVVVLGVSVPDGPALDLVARLCVEGSDTQVVALVAREAAGAVAAALERGALTAVEGPVEPRALVALVRGAGSAHLRERRARYFADREHRRADIGTFVYAAPRMAELMRHMQSVARSTVPAVLVTGECGTGKAAVARMVHDSSSRGGGPFVDLDCSVVPVEEMDGELFGWRGMPGGGGSGQANTVGLLEVADGGTLFLDQVAELGLSTQAKLLAFLEHQTVQRGGAGPARRLDVRVVASTTRDLRALVAAGTFREELHNRLQTFTLALPPLRERPEDVESLSRLFMARAVREHARRFRAISPEAMELLQSYRWPGNVWELRFVISRAVMRYDDEVMLVPHLSHVLPDPMLAVTSMMPRAGDGGVARTVIPTLAAVELTHIRRVLEICDGNRTLAAHHLGITRQTLAKKIGAVDEP